MPKGTLVKNKNLYLITFVSLLSAILGAFIATQVSQSGAFAKTSRQSIETNKLKGTGGKVWLEPITDYILGRRVKSAENGKVLILEGDSVWIPGEEGGVLPSGAICMWKGYVSSIPAGWQFCDGTNGTPDLRNEFVLGASTTIDSGGSASHSHIYTDVIRHTHTLYDSTHTHTYYGWTNIDLSWGSAAQVYNTTTASCDSSKSGVTVDSAGVTNPATQSASSLPPYYKLAFIMKL